MSRRIIHWTRSLGMPMSKGGSQICEKHEFIESNSADPEMAYEIAEAARAALEDGQNMERALKERKDANEEIQSDLDWANEQIKAMQAHARRLRISQLRRMADACKSLFSRAIETSERRAPEFPPAERIIAINARIRRFRAACLAEIERLRGEG